MMLFRLFVFLALIFFPSLLFAQDEASVHASMRKALVYIEVSGQQANGVPLQSSGTGVLMDDIGHVLTVLHLITDVEDKALDGEFEVTVRVGDRSSNPRPATVVRRDMDRDVLVLRTPTATDPYQPACFGNGIPPLPDIGMPFLTSGFPIDVPYFTGSGKVTTKDGPKGLFGIDIPISSGQSGSPVYDSSGRVLGLIVGSIEGQGISGQDYYRPLRLVWDVVQNYVAGENCGNPENSTPMISVVIMDSPKEVYLVEGEETGKMNAHYIKETLGSKFPAEKFDFNIVPVHRNFNDFEQVAKEEPDLIIAHYSAWRDGRKKTDEVRENSEELLLQFGNWLRRDLPTTKLILYTRVGESAWAEREEGRNIECLPLLPALDDCGFFVSKRGQKFSNFLNPIIQTEFGDFVARVVGFP